jgi:hypothetical protein
VKAEVKLQRIQLLVEAEEEADEQMSWKVVLTLVAGQRGCSCWQWLTIVGLF